MKKTKTKQKEKCADCGHIMYEKTDIDINGVPYRYWSCSNCGREVLDMSQLHETALIYKKMRKSQAAKVSKWGSALAIRIPREIVVEQKIKAGEKFRFLKEKNGFKLILEKD